MPIAIQCPNASCRSQSVVADAVAGRGVKCKKCGTPFKAVATLDGLPSDTKPSSPSSSVPFAMLPAEFGRYRVLSLLGQGGMGAVYLAEDTQLGRKVALKLPSFDVSETKRLERFVREAKASAGLQHPNICAVHDAGVIAGRPFISMAYINGKTLDDAIDPDRPMNAKRAVEIVRKIALALQDAHENGIVHRDLKPANVMMSAKGEPVVMDFGLAKNLGEFDERESKLTQPGAVMGTPSYMSPEQVRGDIEQIGPATDIYALGVMLFELLTGRTPYGGSMGLVLARILTAPVPPLREFRPDADVRLEAICQQAMAKDIAERPASMAMLAAQLGEYLKHADAVPVIATLLREVPFDDLVEVPVTKKVRAKRTRKAKPARWPMIVGSVVLGLLLVVVGIQLTVRTKQGTVAVATPEKAVEEFKRKDEKQTVPTPIARAPSDLKVSPAYTAHEKQTVPTPIARGPFARGPMFPGDVAVDLSGRKGGDEVSFEIADGVKMLFCWIPAGKATLGSPMTEKDRGFTESEHEFATDGFWLAKTECTQNEWESVMGSNPSFFCASGDGKAKVQGIDTGNFPVERVSWDDTQLFLKKLNARDGVAKAFGKSGAFKLPHEDQWEYACRGGKGNKQPFYWGDALNGDKANAKGDFPYGRETKGTNLERTTVVGSYATVAAHQWGLSDMSGNVWEWCDNSYGSEQTTRMLRGGSWGSFAMFCRAANRRNNEPAFQFGGIGFRVCFSLDR